MIQTDLTELKNILSSMQRRISNHELSTKPGSDPGNCRGGSGNLYAYSACHTLAYKGH